MYNEDSDDGSGSDCSDFLSVPVKKKRNKTKELTWAEAAEIILKRFDHPLPPKEVLRLMQEDDLKTGITASSPVAVLNAVLNNQSKGVNPLFYKCPSGASSYGLVRTRKRPGTTMTKAPPYTPPKQNQITREVKELPKREARVTKKLNPPTAQISRSLNPPGKAFPAPSGLRVKKPLIPPGEKTPVTNITNRYTPPLGSLSKAAYLERLKQQPQHRRMMGPTTSALVRPSPPFSRPPPGAALRVMPPKKRVKIDKDENDSDSSTQSKNDDEPIRKRPLVTKIKINNDARKGMPRNIPPRSAIKQQLKQPRSITPEFKNKINHRSISRTANNKVSSLQRKLAPPTINTNKHLSQMKKSSSQSSLHSPVTNRRLANASSSLSRLKTASSSSGETRDHNKFFVGSKVFFCSFVHNFFSLSMF
uniref:HTH HARE-type domain-containing protein n=1 Tax=Clytia hemisphaerica TaxID=252671 RepID=A0A7M5X0G8_9CNID